MSIPTANPTSSSTVLGETGGVVKRFAATGLGPPNIAMYGATCDGTTDDSTAYDLARAALTASGATALYIPSETLAHGVLIPAGLHTVMPDEFAVIGTDNKIANPTFATSADGWTLGTGWAAASGPDRIVKTAGTASSASCTGVTVAVRQLYQLQVTITTTTDGVVNFKIGTQNLFGANERFINAAGSGTVPGDWFSATAVATRGTETSPGVGLEQLKPVSATTFYYTIFTTVSGSLTFSIDADSRWAGNISNVRLVKVEKTLQPISSATTVNDPNAANLYGMKIAQSDYGLLAIGDNETAALINGFATGADYGALNVLIGEKCGRSLFDGNENVALGSYALENAEGSGNTALGYSALKYAQKGMENTAVGYKSQANCTQGYANTSLGFRSAFYNSRGINNVSLGHQAHSWNAAGNYNVAVGYQAGYNTGSDGNTEVGYQAGSYLGLFSSTLYSYTGVCSFGYQSRAYGNSALSIGNQARVGEYDGTNNKTWAYVGAIAIGDAAKVVGTGSIAIGDGASVGSTSEVAGGTATPYANAIAIGPSVVNNTADSAIIGTGQTRAKISGRVHSRSPMQSNTDAAGVTYTATEFVDSVLLSRSGPAGNFSDTTPTAAQIVAAIPGCEVGTGYSLYIRNTTANTLTLLAGSGVTLAGTTTVAGTKTRHYIVQATNVTASSEAVSVVGVSSADN